MKLQQLRYFQAACRLNSITRAAEQLHVSQPSVSAAIRELEQEFGVTLFSRRYRGFTLTQEGADFLAQVDSLLAHADQTEEILKDIGRKRNLIRLGVPPMIGSILLPRLFRDFREQYPDTKMSVYEASSRELVQQLAEDRLDLAFLPHTAPFSGEYRWMPVIRMETVLCVSSSHPMAERNEVHVRELAEEPLVLFKEGYFQSEQIAGRFARSGLMPDVLLSTSQLSTIISLVRNGSASGFLFRAVADRYPGLVPVSLDPPLEEDVSLVWKKGGFLFSDMNHFIEFVRENIQEGRP